MYVLKEGIKNGGTTERAGKGRQAFQNWMKMRTLVGRRLQRNGKQLRVSNQCMLEGREFKRIEKTM